MNSPFFNKAMDRLKYCRANPNIWIFAQYLPRAPLAEVFIHLIFARKCIKAGFWADPKSGLDRNLFSQASLPDLPIHPPAPLFPPKLPLILASPHLHPLCFSLLERKHITTQLSFENTGESSEERASELKIHCHSLFSKSPLNSMSYG